MRLFRLTRPLLGMFDAETAHRLTLATLRLGLVPAGPAIDSPALAMSVMGLRFPNPVGLAAGFDKDAKVVDAVLKQGFGFVEVGSLTLPSSACLVRSLRLGLSTCRENHPLAGHSGR